MRNAYECMVILEPDLPEDQTQATLGKIREIVTQHEGEVMDLDLLGKRRLAYAIRKQPSGFFAVFQFVAEALPLDLVVTTPLPT